MVMRKYFWQTAIILVAMFFAKALVAQDTQDPNVENLTLEEAEIIKNSQDSEAKIESLPPEGEGFAPAPDSDILPPQEVMIEQIENEKELILDNGNKNSSAIISDGSENYEDRKIISQTPHRKREIDPAKRADLVELSRVFGELHAIRSACSGASDQTYRSKMTSMLDLEAPQSSFIREPLIIAFNFGFQQKGGGNGECSEDKNAAKEAELAKIGRKYSLKLAAYYSGVLQKNN